MSYDGTGLSTLNYAPCKYAASPLVFRGPERRLTAPYVAFLGGTETYGKYIKTPFPALVESDIGVNCINFGIMNAGVDVFLNDPALLSIANEADLAVVQVVGCQNLSNRYYTVHPRRNDRFVTASDQLKSLFPEIDFSDFNFVKHMLSALHAASKERFATVRAELQTAWLARMNILLRQVTSRVVLVWFADHAPLQDEPVGPDPAGLQGPLFVTRQMLDQLRPHIADMVEVCPSRKALDAGTKGMIFNDLEALAAREMMGPSAHGEAALKLGRALHRFL